MDILRPMETPTAQDLSKTCHDSVNLKLLGLTVYKRKWNGSKVLFILSSSYVVKEREKVIDKQIY